jgi:hypothetical protein
MLAPDAEAQLARVLEKTAAVAAKRGVLVKPFFDDASKDPNSPRVVNHVMPHQFKQVRRRFDRHSCCRCVALHVLSVVRYTEPDRYAVASIV